MMIGEGNFRHPTVHVPPWALIDAPTVDPSFPFSTDNADDYSPYFVGDEFDLPVESFSCDNFRMFEFKVRKCMRGSSHDWTECPYAHPGEKARRRDPRRYLYSGTACPDFRKGNCGKGDFCEFAHGVFECWLHPTRYRTQLCKDGSNCLRRVCFFAHSPDQLRVLSPTSSPTESPPVSPVTNSLSRSLGSNSINEMVASLRQLHLTKVKSMPTSWGSMQMGSTTGYGSMGQPGFCSLPSTPTRSLTRRRIGFSELWKSHDEPLMERVESGRDLRAKLFQKLSRENPLDSVDPAATTQGPDVGWVSELVK